MMPDAMMLGGIADPARAGEEADWEGADAEAWLARGLARAATGAAGAAADCLERARALAPARLDYAAYAAEAAVLAGEGAVALARAEARVEACPEDAAALHGLAVLLHLLGRRAEALDLLEAVCVLLPEAPEPWALRGRLLVRTLRLDEAVSVLGRARALAPDDVALANDHAVAVLRTERYGAALECLEALVARPGTGAMELANLANARLAVGDQAGAMRAALAADAAGAQGAVADGARSVASTLAYQPDVTGAVLRDALIACGARHGAAVPKQPPVFTNTRDPERRLKVGLLSGTMKVHPVGWLAAAGLEALDRDALSLVALANNTADDWLGRRFRAMTARWIAVDTMPDAEVAALGRVLGLDILIDLGGWGDHGRMAACAHRIAPVQIKWVGSQFHTSGLREMDWIITDARETPPGTEPFYVERLLRLPDGYVCYTTPPDAPPVTPLPARASGAVTFGCFNNLAKVNDDVVRVWADILGRVPGSRLLLQARQLGDRPTEERTRARFAAAGVAPARVLTRPGAPHRAFLAAYEAVDIALDPFPYSGGLTTCEAMLQGVPVLTLPGETFASRHSLSHVMNAGLGPDWVARDEADYVARAVAAARDLDALAGLRAGLRARMTASPLCDAPRFGAHLGAALRSAWRDWCARGAEGRA